MLFMHILFFGCAIFAIDLLEEKIQKASSFWLVNFGHVTKTVVNIYKWTLFYSDSFVYVIFSLSIGN